MTWETVIGLEIHAQLATKSKIFSGSSTAFGSEANSQASLIDLGYPGVLPVLNQKVIEFAIRFGLATHCEISSETIFSRKNYFYPDLPKGYQISQLDKPIVHSGYVDIPIGDTLKRIRITRAHLEEDAGKSIHNNETHSSYIDLNRAGTPLLEIVSEPDIRSAKEASEYMKYIHLLVKYLGICDGNLQEGSFRCDANVSIRHPGDKLGTRAEIKNLNSFRFIEKAINYEVQRQIELLEQGLLVKQETRLYDDEKGITRSMRSKEESNDYRYFPDPDLLPIHISNDFIEKIKAVLPELPEIKASRFINVLKLSKEDATRLIENPELANFFEKVLNDAKHADPKQIANWVIGKISNILNERAITINEFKLSSYRTAQIIDKAYDGTLSQGLAYELIDLAYDSDESIENIIADKGLSQISDEGAINKMLDQLMSSCGSQVADYRSGNEKILGYLVGQAMKLSEGKANPKAVRDLLIKKIKINL
jgi:aspartyl-tRNA(Asn)/glutamyl-tRNA(Gln) amidotransferase subunit B